jgi:hypothetical protein
MKVATALLTAAALALFGVLFGPAGPASAAARSFDLYAVVGTDAVMPGGQSVHVWGYNDTNAPVSRPGGPTLVVDQGDEVTITLHNQLGETSGLLVQGQHLVPDLSGTAAGSTKTYTFTAGDAGTYLYEAAPLPNAQHQVALGLYGALVVRPAASGQAYASSATAYDDEAVLVLGEIDPALNNAPNPAAFDMRGYAPRYFLVNGRAHPDTTPVTTTGGNRLLLRYVNAGTLYHSMEVLGAQQNLVALDGSPLAHGRRYVAETFGPGQTADAIVTAPSSTVDVAMSLFDGSLLLHNSNVASGGFGGMISPIEVAPDLTPVPGDHAGPISVASFDADVLTATVDDSTRGGWAVTAAQYNQDAAKGPATAMTAAGPDFTAPVSVGPGPHILYVRAKDAGDNWGPLTSVLVDGSDAGGPTTKFPTLTPSLTNHASTAGVTVSATADDSAAGGSNIKAAEYSIDGDTAVPMTVNAQSSIASVDATIPASVVNGLAEGSRVISIRSQDAQDNWGDAITINLSVDLTPPTTIGVSASPSPNNGTRAFSASTPAVRVVATTMSDPIASSLNSPISRAEAFLDTPGANGSGIPLTASDGVFNDTSEGGYADIPLTTVKQLANGNHTISVHARDAAGNWGPMGTTTLVVDKLVPTLTGVTVTPSPSAGARSATLTATATDTLSPLAAAEWFIGTDPGVGKATPFTVGSGPSPASLSTTLDTSTMAENSYTLRVRVKDAAGNWSALSSATLVVTAPLFYSTTGNANPPGVGGTADDADIYSWSGTAHSRAIDISAAPYNIPGGANVDSFVRVDATHFYVSFTGNVAVPGVVGAVADEDIAYYNAGTWSRWFDGSAHGLSTAFDIGAMTISDGTLYFSTTNTAVPPGAGGTGDDADVYRWNSAAPGNSYTRVFDASGAGSAGLPAAAEVDGLDYVGSHLYLSFSGDTTVPVVGAVQDEDVVHLSGSTWSVYFNGTGHGLTSAALDIDAFDVP